ncbi:hypothetical protein [Sinosporangium album]|uniref:hypothetical protein n=1 Tax=Sinosporangium album TaxID=504805 RepID=UPI000B897B41|nr:hypothetical protein [Sinosporangium album]
MTRQVPTSPGAAFDLGHRVVRCPWCRRPVPGGRVEARLREPIGAGDRGHGRRVAALEVVPGCVHLPVKAQPENPHPGMRPRGDAHDLGNPPRRRPAVRVLSDGTVEEMPDGLRGLTLFGRSARDRPDISALPELAPSYGYLAQGIAERAGLWAGEGD